jgi:hypothetical protein
MSETKNVEQKASGAPVDYSRPVGWWCPVCGMTNATSIGPDGRGAKRFCIMSARTGFCFRRAIPVYMPLPTPEPVEVDEVETGEAEVVTTDNSTKVSFLASIDASWTVDRDGCAWFEAESFCYSDGACVDQINRIAAASANARKKRGMK